MTTINKSKRSIKTKVVGRHIILKELIKRFRKIKKETVIKRKI